MELPVSSSATSPSLALTGTYLRMLADGRWRDEVEAQIEQQDGEPQVYELSEENQRSDNRLDPSPAGACERSLSNVSRSSSSDRPVDAELRSKEASSGDECSPTHASDASLNTISRSIVKYHRLEQQQQQQQQSSHAPMLTRLLFQGEQHELMQEELGQPPTVITLDGHDDKLDMLASLQTAPINDEQGATLNTLMSPASQGHMQLQQQHYGSPAHYAGSAPVDHNMLIDNGISHVRAVQHSLAYERTLAAHAAAREPTPRYTQPRSPERDHPKPIYSYSCLIALALKNSHNMCLTVAEIYAFMCENFPYFRTAPAGWKNSVRHNLSLNKCFEKIVHDAPGGHGRKSCQWTMNANKVNKMNSEIRKWREKDPKGVLESLTNSVDLESVEGGTKGMPVEVIKYALAHGQNVDTVGQMPTHALTPLNRTMSAAVPSPHAWSTNSGQSAAKVPKIIRQGSYLAPGRQARTLHSHQQFAAVQQQQQQQQMEQQAPMSLARGLSTPLMPPCTPPKQPYIATYTTTPHGYNHGAAPFAHHDSAPPSAQHVHASPFYQQPMMQQAHQLTMQQQCSPSPNHALSCSSPLSQTPPYSPNAARVASQAAHQRTPDWSAQAHRQLLYQQQQQHFYSPLALTKLTAPIPNGSPSAGLFMPHNGGGQMAPRTPSHHVALEQQQSPHYYYAVQNAAYQQQNTPYKCASSQAYAQTQNALHNNALLLAQSPSTLQSL